jgi:hypothetical protein
MDSGQGWINYCISMLRYSTVFKYGDTVLLHWDVEAASRFWLERVTNDFFVFTNSKKLRSISPSKIWSKIIHVGCGLHIIIICDEFCDVTYKIQWFIDMHGARQPIIY